MNKTKVYGPWLKLDYNFYSSSSSSRWTGGLCEGELHKWFIFPRGSRVRLFATTRYISQKTYLYAIDPDDNFVSITYMRGGETRDATVYLMEEPYNFLKSAHKNGYRYLGIEYQEID